MPKFNHPTFGDVQSYAYLEGEILAVYLEGDGSLSSEWDTADVQYEDTKIFKNAPIRYHCQRAGVDRDNGAIVDAARGFDAGDKVILMAKIGTTPGKGEEYEQMYVVAHRYGVEACVYNYLLIRVGDSLKPISQPYGGWSNGVYVRNAEDDLLHEYVTVWDVRQGKPASVKDPRTGTAYSFPITMEDLKPVLDYFQFVDEELFTLGAQGDAQSQEAGFTPDWTSDVQGEKIRAGAPPSAWWTSYDIYANPIFKLLSETSLALFTDSEGAANGTFAKAMEKYGAAQAGEGEGAPPEGEEDKRSQIQKWKDASPQAFGEEVREFDVTGSDTSEEIPPEDLERLQELQGLIGELTDLIAALDSAKISRYEELYAMVPISDPALQAEFVSLSASPDIIKYRTYSVRMDQYQQEINSITGEGAFTAWAIAHDKNGDPLKGTSYHMQNAYGEDEIWVCAKNIYGGLVVDYCDAMWKFVRLTNLPPVIPIGNPAAERLAGNPFTGLGGMAMGNVLSMNDIEMMLAIDASQAGDGGNIFSYATLKRINDGGFHRTSHPALRHDGVGSWRMTQNGIPGLKDEPVFITAMNTRLESIDVWHRYDNWMMSLLNSYATYGVDRTWWFKSNAEQWRIKAHFIDTPLGSMWYEAPAWEAGIWYMSGFNLSAGAITARRDLPLHTKFYRETKHSRRILCQIYIVQRQALTMFEDPTLVFVKQEQNKGIYDHLDPATISFVGGIDYDTLDDEQKKNLISDRVYLRTRYPDEVGYNPPVALRANRNEVEIMAACDLYSTLRTNFGRMHPNDQVRNGLLEYGIQKLITKYYADEGFGPKDYSEFQLEARIV